MAKKEIIKYALTFLMLSSAALLWFSIARATAVADSSSWLVPISWAALFFVSASLSFVLVEDINWIRGVIFLSFLLSFFFAFHWTGILAVLSAFLLSSSAFLRIRKDLLLNIKVDLRKSLNAGKALFILALSIMITAQYYAQIQGMEAEKIIPRFNFSTNSNRLVSEILAASNPQFRQIQNDDLTVDEFIWENQKSQLGTLDGQDIPASLSNTVLETNKKKIIEEGRKTLSEMSGKKIAGNEKISDVFADVVNNKIGSYFQPVTASDASFPILPYIMALVLFLTVAPLGSFLGRFLVYLVFGIFVLMVKTEMVKIAKVMMEVERIRED
jgi:hypothetical protein